MTHRTSLDHQAFADQVPALVLAFTTDGHVAVWNRACESLTGYSREDMMTRDDPLALLFPTCGCQDRLREAISTEPESPHRLLCVFTTRIGKQRTVAWTCKWRGTLLWCVGVELTGLDQEADALRATEARAHVMFDRMSDGLLTLNDRWVVTSMNPAAERLLECSASRAVGRKMWEALPNVERSELEAKLRNVMETREPSSFECRCKVGAREGWFEVRATPLAHGDVAVLFTDISERREAEEKLRRAEQHYRSLVERADMGFIRVTPDGWYLYVSPQVHELAGVEPERFYREGTEILKRTVHPDDLDAVLGMVARRTVEPRFEDMEFRAFAADGTTRWFLYRQTPVLDGNGEALFYDNLWVDITERKALEEQLLHAQKMEAVGTLAGGLAHDFNNLLTAILGNISLTRDELGEDHPVTKRLDAAERGANRAAALTRQLLSFARKHRPKRETVNLCEAISDSVNILRRGFGHDISLKMRLGEEDIFVLADPAQIGQVFMNLCVNARDAMPGGGTLTVSCDTVEVDEARHADAAAGRYARITVADTGTGMSEDVKQRAFEPFFTTKSQAGGTGLGLSVAYGIVQQHGGFFHVDSTPGEGTTFEVYLPLVDKPAPQAPAMREARPELRGAETVLVVDDEEMVRTLLRGMLERNGYTVLEAEHGAACLDVVRNGATRVDAVLLDVKMPRLSGRHALDQLLHIRPDLPVIVISGYISDEERSLVEQGAHSILQKPFTAATVLTAIRKALDEGS